jgi:hypothetical protein
VRNALVLKNDPLCSRGGNLESSHHLCAQCVCAFAPFFFLHAIMAPKRSKLRKNQNFPALDCDFKFGALFHKLSCSARDFKSIAKFEIQ